MRISDWSSDVCSSDLPRHLHRARHEQRRQQAGRRGGLPQPQDQREGEPWRPALGARAEAAAAERHDRRRRALRQDRKSVVWGKSGAGRVDIGGRRFISKKKTLKKEWKRNKVKK